MKWLKTKTAEHDYYDNCHTWSNDIYSQAVIWRNWSLLFAILSFIIAILATVALIKLFPLKENTPFLVFVDNQKGEPITIQPAATEDLIENIQLKKYMIRKFIIARHRYHHDTVNEDKQTVEVLSTLSVNQDYLADLNKNEKDSQLNVANINVLFLNEQRAYVSFVILVNQDGIIREIPVNADIKFHFTDKLMTLDEAQMINPVNFEVLSYQSHYQVNNEVFL